ncbi:hypothetical protein TEU_00515 [Thermococcus eurythermalis]|uniref:DUF2357 domain-containing protein n=1 Tax=Thermococcus eurythermalis TaxID=1505907 RepID=A0A097QR32_9EURY|nr:DUF2357 domain-containing protein [Thermococcus eurythermalis]AIU68937.1 hypothetical protein TEU_00515 [Thermococcus eurythermalis]
MECIEGKEITSTKSGCWTFSDGERWYLFEWVDYLLKPEIDTDEVLVGKIPATKLRNGQFLISFKNFIGETEITGVKNGEIVFKRPVKVLSLKFSKIYPNVFASMNGHGITRFSKVQDLFVGRLIEDVIKHSLSMPFQLESPTGFAVEESDEPVNELFAYHYLRSNKTRIIEAFEIVVHRMKRELRVEEEWLRPDEVDEVTPETLISITEHPEYLAPAGEGVLVARYLNGYVPTKVLGSRKYKSFDTPENRFAKHFLGILIEWSERVINAFENGKKADLKLIRELLEELEFVRSDDIWEEIGDMTLFPYTSQTLLKGDGYRDLLELYREFTAYSPFFEGLQKAIDNRDIAKLYEYWAFFRLVEELGRVLGKKDIRIVVTPAGELSESGDVYAQFDNGRRLYYNKRLIPRKWSYSVTLRPDFSLFTGDPDETGTELVGVFDAKFKLDVVDEPKEIEGFDKEDEEAERSRNYTTWAKLEDIYKMHTYRDALRCNFAVVLYPGRRSVFFDIDKGRLSGSFDFSSLLSRDLKGVGYIRVAPEVKL